MSQQALYPLFNKGIEKHFGFEFKDYPKTWSKIFHVDTTNKRYIDAQGYAGFQLPQRRSPGETIPQDSLTVSFSKRYIMDSYGLGTSVADEDMDDDLYGFMNRYIPSTGGEFARAFGTLMEVVTANYFALFGFASGTSVAGMSDSRSLFNTAHPVSAFNQGVTLSNRPSTDADLSIATAQAGSLGLRLQKAQNNVQFINNPVRALVIHPNLGYVSQQIHKQTMERGTSDNNTNYLQQEAIDIIMWPYFQKSGTVGALTNAYNAYFYIGQQHFLNFFMRQAFRMKSDYDVNTNSNIFAGTARFGFGADDWRGTWGSTGA